MQSSSISDQQLAGSDSSARRRRRIMAIGLIVFALFDAYLVFAVMTK